MIPSMIPPSTHSPQPRRKTSPSPQQKNTDFPLESKTGRRQNSTYSKERQEGEILPDENQKSCEDRSSRFRTRFGNIFWLFFGFILAFIRSLFYNPYAAKIGVWIEC